jgi:putative ATP-binding cassette transporter
MAIVIASDDEGAGYRLEPRVAKAFARFSGGFWQGEGARRAWALTIGLFLLLLLSTAATVALNHWNRWFFDSLEARNVEQLSRAVLVFAVIIASMAAVGVGIVFTRETLQVRWREWIVARMLDRWLAAQRFQRLSAKGGEPQNPEYRIADDTRWATEPLVDLGIGLVLALVNAGAFIAILWSVGGSYSLRLSDATTITIPAYLVLVAIAYGVIASWLMLKVGAALPGCVARRNEAEGHFRFGMMRLRDNADSVALQGGGPGERRILGHTYDRVVQCWLAIVRQHARLTWITNASGPMIPIVPLLFAAPKYISGDLTLGQVTQLAAAFVQVQIAISWLVDHYGKIAEWYASARRVMEIVEACDQLPGEDRANEETTSNNEAERAPSAHALSPLPVWRINGQTISRGQWVQFHGDSNSGKSTLVRQLVGLETGATDDTPTLAAPAHPSTMVLPQRSYLPPGSLRDILNYPGDPARYPDPELVGVLNRVGLAGLAARLDETPRWDTLLSLGERQRLAAARVLLNKPQAVMIDDALTALDEVAQRAIFQAIRDAVPQVTVLVLSRHPICADCFDQVLPLGPHRSGIEP